MRILSFYPTRTFKLILEFDNQEYRILDMKEFLKNDNGLLKDMANDINLFLSAELDEVAGTISWRNGVDFDPSTLYGASQNLDLAVRKMKGIKPKKITRVSKFNSKLSKENERIINLLRSFD